MSKKLKIQFWKAKKTLAMQILEQEGLPEYKGNGFVQIYQSIGLKDCRLNLRGIETSFDLYIEQKYFPSNAERDAYLQKAVNAITDELFAGEGELKIGEMCEVRDAEFDIWEKRKLLAILPEQYNRRFIAETEGCPDEYSSWDCARPIGRTEPKIEECGQLITYTWWEK